MSTNKLDADARDDFGKGAARKLRVAGKTPVVLYGHGTEPVHLAVETHPLSLIVRQANAIVELKVDGKKQLALVKDVQKNHVKQEIEHVDLLIVKKGETVVVDVPVVVEGEPFNGTTAIQALTTLSVEVAATKIPENLVVSVEGAEEGTQINAGDVELPEDATLLTEAEELVVQVIVPILDTETTAETAEDAEAEDAEGAEAEGAEGEGSEDGEAAEGDDAKGDE